MTEEYLGALPKLYNAPAYARPPRAIVIERPFDPDDLPLEAHRSAHDQAFLNTIVGVAADAEQSAEGGSLIRRALEPFGRREGLSAEPGG